MVDLSEIIITPAGDGKLVLKDCFFLPLRWALLLLDQKGIPFYRNACENVTQKDLKLNKTFM